MEPTKPLTPPSSNRRTLIFAAVGIFALLLIVISIFSAKQAGLILAGPKLSLSKPFAANFSHAKQMDSHTLYYYSGSAFVSYDLTTYKTKPLTPIYALPNQIDEIVWSKQGALINATGYSVADQLYPTLPTSGLDPNLNYWWFVNFQTGAISLVGDLTNAADVRGAAWQGSGSFIYGEKLAEGKDIAVMKRDATGAITKLATLPDGAVIIDASAKAVTYTQRDSSDHNALMVIDLASKKATTAIKDIGAVLATGPNNAVLAITQVGKASAGDIVQGSLQLYDYTKNKVQNLANEFDGSASWIPGTNDWAVAGYEKLTTPSGFTGKDGKVSRFSLRASKNSEGVLPRYLVAGQSGDNVLVLDQLSQLLIAGAKTSNQLPSLPDTDKLKDDLTDPAYLVSYDPDKKEYAAYILENPYQTNLALVLSRIQRLGVDPYQLNLRWYADESVDPGFRLPPDFDPIDTPAPLSQPEPDEGD